MIPLVYHPAYDLNLGTHVFPAQKYRLIRERLADSPVHTPEPATDAQVQLVHSPAWTTALRDGTLTPRQLQTLEIPWSPAMAHGFRLAAGGTLLAARLALAHGAAYTIGGGFHPAAYRPTSTQLARNHSTSHGLHLYHHLLPHAACIFLAIVEECR